jgi:hypothetical protein
MCIVALRLALNPLHAFPERLNSRVVRGIAADQHVHGIGDIAHILVGRVSSSIISFMVSFTASIISVFIT